MKLSEAFDLFEECDGIVPAGMMGRCVASVELDERDFGHYILFDEKSYRRNHLYAGAKFQALVICWRPGQRSPIHDHKGSSCVVRVLKGVATETKFERLDGVLRATRACEMAVGATMTSYDSDIHEVSNEGAEDMVTLHVYSPPLLRMGVYSTTGPLRTEEEYCSDYEI
jgi:cysteine dioxygenase